MIQKISLLLPIFLMLCCGKSSAQKHDYIWLSGYDSNTVDSSFGGTNIDFNSSPIQIEYVFREMSLLAASANICDEDGNLLFYANGCEIAGADQNILENGEGINPGEIHDDWCFNWFAYPARGASMILPLGNNLYYLMHSDFHLDIVENPPSADAYPANLYYSKVNMDSAKVVEKNVVLLHDTLVGSDIAAVKHINNTDWWFLTHKRDTALSYKFLITPDTVYGPYTQNIGLPIYRTGAGGGQALFSPDGNTYVYYDPDTDIMIYDFDRETGQLSNFRHISLPDSMNVLFGGAAISSNSRFLYISNSWDLYQFDLWAPDIEASKVHIGHYDGFAPLPFELPTDIYRMQLAPDCRIYISSRNAAMFHHVIHYPNLKGLDCAFEQHAIALSTYNAPGYLPIFPNYRLGTGEVCDSTIALMTGIVPVLDLTKGIRVFPNPVRDNLNIQLNDKEIFYQINVFDLAGSLVFSEEINASSLSNLYAVSFSNFPSGLYFLEVISNKKRYVEKLVKH